MYKIYLGLLGLALAALWVMGLRSPTASSATAWFDGAVAVLAFAGALAIRATSRRPTVAAGIVWISVALFAIWLQGVLNLAVPWQSGWTLFFAVLTLMVGIDAGLSDRPLTRQLDVDRDETERAIYRREHRPVSEDEELEREISKRANKDVDRAA